MTDRMAWTFPAGRFVQEVTSVTLVNATTKTIDTTVPANKRWLLLSVKATNGDNVARVVGLYLFKEAAKTNLISVYDSASVNTAEHINFPNTIASRGVRSRAISPGEVLEAGNTISVIWTSGGASAGATDADGLVICYLEIHVP